MNIKIKRIDPTLPLPSYQTSGSAAFDMYTRETRTIPPHGLDRLPSNLIIQTPPGYALILSARSSLAKKGLILPNGIGIIDQDYCGEEDEILFSVYNITDAPITVERGERLAQGMFVRVDQGKWDEVKKMTNENRRGFGSTGKF